MPSDNDTLYTSSTLSESNFTNMRLATPGVLHTYLPQDTAAGGLSSHSTNCLVPKFSVLEREKKFSSYTHQRLSTVPGTDIYCTV